MHEAEPGAANPLVAAGTFGGVRSPFPPAARRHWPGAPILVLSLVLAALPSAAADLAEPGERDMRRAYAAFLQQSFGKQGNLLDPHCNVAGKGCSVVLLDIRRDYRLKDFKKRKCDPERPIGFACSFQATVTCAYSSNGKPNPLVADIYCGPLFNKPSVYNAVFEYDRSGWTIARFTQG